MDSAVMEQIATILNTEDGSEAANFLDAADLSGIERDDLDKVVRLAVETEPTDTFYFRVVDLVSDDVRQSLHDDIAENWDIEGIETLFADDRSQPYRDAIARAIIASDNEIDGVYPVCVSVISEVVRKEFCNAMGKNGNIDANGLATLVREHVATEDVDALLDGLLESVDEETVFDFMKQAGSHLSDAHMLRLARSVQEVHEE